MFLLIGACRMFWVGAQSGDDLFKQKQYIQAIMAYEKEVKTNPSKNLPLAKCYFAQKQFSKATEALRLYKQKANTADTMKANQWISLLERPDEETRLMNLGTKVNTPSSAYYPHVSADGQKLYYSCRNHAGGKGGDDIYMMEQHPDGSWSESQNMECWNTHSHEALLTTGLDGNTAILAGNYNGTFGNADLYYSVKTSVGWSMPCNLGGVINSSHREAYASLGPDGRTLLFCSDRDDQKDISDIFISFLTASGWTPPRNLGPLVNQKGFDEVGPMLAADNKTLYFSSDRPGGFGQHDLYMSRRLDDTWTNWSPPINLGKYINTLEDDEFMSIPVSGDVAYTAISGGPDSYGKYDLYKFKLPSSLRPDLNFTVRGMVSNESDSAVGIAVHYLEAESGREVARVFSSAKDGKYIVALPAYKKYEVVMDLDGYLFFRDVLDLSGPSLGHAKSIVQNKLDSQVALVQGLKVKLDQYRASFGANSEPKSKEVGLEYMKYLQLQEDYNWANAQLDFYRERKKLDTTLNYTLTRKKLGAKIELENISFDSVTSTLVPNSESELDKLVDMMKRSDIKIELSEPIDQSAVDKGHLKITFDRLAIIKNYLVRKGISENRMMIVGPRYVTSYEKKDIRSKNGGLVVKISEIKSGAENTDEVYSGLKDSGQNITFFTMDILLALQKAAISGGVPLGCPCCDRLAFIDRRYKSAQKYDFSPGESDHIKTSTRERIKLSSEIGDWHYKNFAAHLINFGYKPSGSGWGVGATFVNKAHRETYFSGFGPTGNTNNGTQWGMSFGQLWTSAMKHKLCISVGYDLHIFKANFISLNAPKSKLDGSYGSLTMPWGFRGFIKLTEGCVINPEAFYYSAVLYSKMMKNEGFGRSGYFHAGVNLRLRMFQGGFFYNYGDFVRFTGFRAGVTF